MWGCFPFVGLPVCSLPGCLIAEPEAPRVIECLSDMSSCSPSALPAFAYADCVFALPALLPA